MTRRLSAMVIAIAAFAGLASAANAEVLTIDGMTPAESDGFAEILSVAIGNFGGSDGRSLAFELEDRLSAVTVSGQPYFDVIGGRSAVQSDATLSGQVTAGVDEYKIVAKRNRCVERGTKDKCLTYKDIDVNCLTRVIDFRAQVRGTRYSDGRSIYTESFPHKKEQTVCEGDEEDFAYSESVIRSMLAETADAIRNDLAPRQYRLDVRVLESRKGMTKAQSNLFKAAVKMTKTNPAEACRMWDDAAQNGLSHVSLSFNRALCAEQRGDLDSAMALYDEADRLAPGKYEVADSLQRAGGHRQAMLEWELHQSGMAENRN
ncbi:hypothetical protein [Parasphingorhabdus sp.]|uniref:hypothetical protein n=1 Tax=Parasphingorhabdus sp. TaxID=2709688 RepID=UPI003A90C691